MTRVGLQCHKKKNPLIQYSRLPVHLRVCYNPFTILKTFMAKTSAQETSKNSCKLRKHVGIRVCSLFTYVLQTHALLEVM
jgi:hypothetical protein